MKTGQESRKEKRPKIAEGLSGEYRDIPIGLLDEPENPTRSVIDGEELMELADSLRKVGVLQPLLVEARGGRYRIHAGHRRYLAARLAQLQSVPCRILPTAGVSSYMIRVHENHERAAINPADESLWLWHLLETECRGDVDTLCGLVGMKRGFVEDRLLLREGDPDVFQAVQRGGLTLAVARELNRYKDAGLLRVRLDAAVAGGATARMVRDWRTADDRLAAAIGVAAGVAPAPAPQPTILVADPLSCALCGSGEDKHELRIVYIHTYCDKVAKRGLLRFAAAETGASTEEDRGD